MTLTLPQRFGPLLLLAVSFLLAGPALAKKKKNPFSAKEAAAYEKQMEQRHNPHDSGAGLLKVEKEMVKYYAGLKKLAYRGGAPSKQAQKRLVKKIQTKIVARLVRIAKIRQLRAATTFRGFWEVTRDSGGGHTQISYLHFSSVDETTDRVSGSLEDPADNPVASFVGYERLNAVSIRVEDLDAEYYLIISGNTFYGWRQVFGGTLQNVTGVRLRGP